ncbi:uncharacterized protein LOC143252549 isoform X2 [Tachypleus tridentatus]|uniref:uncharacterized protein LOC143252549 isoform X2 n=1 Tax=Tachypleus tridentatus TaxID=6853 RepID=UPI003FD0DC8A
MADSVDSTTDLQGLKVADLKKELKSRGLTATGNKNELIERLQKAIHLPKEPVETTEDADEDDVLNDDHLLGDDIKSTDVHETVNEEEILGTLPQQETEITAKPTVKVKPSTITLTQQQVTKTCASKSPSVMGKISGVVKITRPVIQQTFTSEKPMKDTIITEENKSKDDNVVLTSAKNLTPEKRHSICINKFNTSNSVNKLQARAERFGLPNKNSVITTGSLKPTALSGFSVKPVLDLEKLRKRSERFGQSVSAAVKQIEEREKVLKRKQRFGNSISTASVGSEEEKKRRRIERFGCT